MMAGGNEAKSSRGWRYMDDFWFEVTFVHRDKSHAARSVYLVGDFCGWKTDTHAMSPCEEGYSITLLLSEGFYHYKFLVDGEWIQDKSNPHSGGSYDNSIMFVHMDPGVYGVRPQNPPHRDYHRPNSDGSHFQVVCPSIPHDIASHGILQRLIFVYLPPSYHSSTNQCYPVVYAHDGQNVFSTPEHMGGPCRGGWYLDAKLDHWWSEGVLPEFILVAVPNSDYVCIGNRAKEYCTAEFTNVKGDPFTRYLIEVVKKEIDSKFRTLSDAKNTIILGASMGGLLAFTLTLTHPHVFSCGVCVSPSFWYVDKNNQTAFDLVTPITTDLDTHTTGVHVDSSMDLANVGSSNPTVDLVSHAAVRTASPCAPCRVYIDSGDGEGDNMIEAREMRAVLLENGWTAGEDFFYHLDKCREHMDMGITHSESVWAQRVHVGLNFALNRE